MGSKFADYLPLAHGVPVEALIRELEPRDVAACAELAVQREGGHPDAWVGVLSSGIGRADELTLVAVVERTIAGYASTGWLAPSSIGGTGAPDGWYLTGLVVGPQWRRRGIGRALTAARLEWLRPRTREVWYFATALNRPSMDLHREFGFVEVSRDFEIPGVSFTGGVGVLSVKRFG